MAEDDRESTTPAPLLWSTPTVTPYVGEVQEIAEGITFAGAGGIPRAIGRVGVLEWKEKFDDIVKLRRGRPPYDRAAIITVIEELVAGGLVDSSLSLAAFTDWIAGHLQLRGIPAPGDTVLEGICRPTYMRIKAGG
jgi:hypothetical protein